MPSISCHALHCGGHTTYENIDTQSKWIILSTRMGMEFFSWKRRWKSDKTFILALINYCYCCCSARSASICGGLWAVTASSMSVAHMFRHVSKLIILARSPFTWPSIVLRVRVDRKDKRRKEKKRSSKSERKCTSPSSVPWWFHVRLLCVHQIFTCGAQNYLWLFLMLTFASPGGGTHVSNGHTRQSSTHIPRFSYEIYIFMNVIYWFMGTRARV